LLIVTWISNLGGDENWKNRPKNANGEHSMLIDINGDGLPDRVFDHNPEADDQLHVNQHRGFAVFVRWTVFPISETA
jgi:hypothetical protein